MFTGERPGRHWEDADEQLRNARMRRAENRWIDEALASVDGNAVKLTQREYAILELLSSRKGTIVTREMFLNRLYADRHEPEAKIIDIFVFKLRQKLTQATDGSHYIETVWGRGYVLRDPELRRPSVLTSSTLTAG